MILNKSISYKKSLFRKHSSKSQKYNLQCSPNSQYCFKSIASRLSAMFTPFNLEFGSTAIKQLYMDFLNSRIFGLHWISRVVLFGSYHLCKSYMDPSYHWHDTCYYLLCPAMRTLISYIPRGRPLFLTSPRRILISYVCEADPHFLCSRDGHICFLYSMRRTICFSCSAKRTIYFMAHEADPCKTSSTLLVFSCPSRF